MPEMHTGAVFGVIVQGDGAVFGAVRRAKDPKGRAEYSQKGMVTSS